MFHDIKLIVEFDGYQHYNNSKTQRRDIQNNKKYFDLGYKVIRIPYFIQLTASVYKRLFIDSGFDLGINYNRLVENFSHGFVDSKALSPIDFNIIGWNRFLYEMARDFREEQYDVFGTCYEDLFWLNKNVLVNDVAKYSHGFIKSGGDCNGMLKTFFESIGK